MNLLLSCKCVCLIHYILGLYVSGALAQTTACPTSLKPAYPTPVAASGWQAQLLTKNLTKPRGIIIDSLGNLLVIQQNSGILHLELSDPPDNCLVVVKTTNLFSQTDLNHGISLSNDGRTLYASSSESVFSWSYNSTTPSISDRQAVITGMSNSDHTTRTLLMSSHQNGTLIVSRGSNENLDPIAREFATGYSQIRAFGVAALAIGQSYDFTTQGKSLGWGLRNSVGIAEHPQTGGLYSVENSADGLKRNGVDIHEDNPGEELNFHGKVEEAKGGNYGYPDCFAAWGALDGLKTGQQFVQNTTTGVNDTTCSNEKEPPRLTFQAHMAPLDIVFNSNGEEAFITFHGSWNRSQPVGYKVSTIRFSKSGDPIDSSDSKTAAVDIFSNADTSKCPGACFRPVGLALDGSNTRLFVTSDATGEIWMLVRTGNGVGSSTITSVATTSGTVLPSSSSATPTSGVTGGSHSIYRALWVVVLALQMLVFGF